MSLDWPLPIHVQSIGPGPPHATATGVATFPQPGRPFLPGLSPLASCGVATVDNRRHACFTDPQTPPARLRVTPVGRLVFVCVQSGVYFPVFAGAPTPPAQTLCD